MATNRSHATSLIRNPLRVAVAGLAASELRALTGSIPGDEAFALVDAGDPAQLAERLQDQHIDAVMIPAAVLSGPLGAALQSRPDVAVLVVVDPREEEESLHALRLGANEFIPRTALADQDVVGARLAAACTEHRHGRRRETMLRWLEREGTIDHLTGLHNRRAFDEKLREACTASSRSGEPVSVVVADVVQTAAINEAYGEAAGDAMIRRLARCVAAATPRTGIAGRAAGDDLAVVLPGAGVDEARQVARRIAQEVEQTNEDEALPLSTRFGIASGVQCDGAQLLDAAVEALHRRVAREMPPMEMGWEDAEGPDVA